MNFNIKTTLFLLLFLFPFLHSSGQNQRVDGFKGIWFALNQLTEYGDKYSGGLGTYTSSHVPVAVYSPEVKKTFFVYGGTTAKEEKHLLIMASFFDHRNKKVAKPVIVYDKMGVDDPHDDASVQLDEHGFVWVFVSGRGTGRPGLIFKSKTPFSIDEFEEVLMGEMTYPQPWWVKGKGFFYLFTKYTGGRELYWSTSSDGKSWAPHQKLAGMGGHYQVSNMIGDTLYSVFNYHPDGDVDKRTNLYVVRSRDMGQTWETVGGKLLQVPLENAMSEALVKDYEEDGKMVYINDLNFDKSGNPVVLAVVSGDHRPGPAGNPRQWVIARFNGKEWEFHAVCTSTHNYDMGSLYIEGEKWTIIGPTGTGPQHWGTGGEMESWTSNDNGKSWLKEKIMTKKSSRNHSYARRPVKAQKDFYAFWADGNADEFSESRLYFADKKGKVWILPYEMKRNMERPRRLK